MKLSLNWLREFVDVRLPAADLAWKITDAIAEVEGHEVIGEAWSDEHIRVAEVVAVEPHPNADRLRLATVETGAGRKTVVCGAPNIAPGQRVAFATEGARLIDGHTGEAATLKLRPIRGVESAGMVLSEKELGLSDDHEGIVVLPADAPIGEPLSSVLGDVVFDLSTWANRADLLGVLGIAREVGALLDLPVTEPDRSYPEGGAATATLVAVAIEDADLCRRFTASMVQGVTIGPSPTWMQERLRKHGMRPINNVVDITNYVMLETGQPLHAFDYDLVRDHSIVVRRAKPGEHLVTLDGIDRALDPEMLMICDGGGPVGVAGVMGGGNSEVHPGTKNVLLEVANFRPGSIRGTTTRLKLRTEASLRFEKGIGPEMAQYAQERALHLFAQITGGRVAVGLVDIYPGREDEPTIDVPFERLEAVLGMEVPLEDATRILTALGFAVHQTGDGFVARPPSWRPDVEIADDVIEEVGRIYGYDRLPATSLRGALPEMAPDPVVTTRERVRDLAVAAGFQEIITYTLTEKETLAKVVPPDDHRRQDPMSVVNPVASQHTYLRTSLRAGLLQTYAANRRLVDGALRLMEVGFEYLPVEGDLPHERQVACGLLGGPREARWPGAASKERLDFYDARGAVEEMLEGLRVDGSFARAEEFALLPGHTAKVSVEGVEVGVVGQVHPSVAAQFDIDEPVFLVELWLEELAGLIPERPRYSAVSRYPEARQDLALLVEAATPAGRVLEVIEQSRLVASAEVFDEYRGQGVPEGQKSLAVRIRYQAQDRTLTDAEVAKAQDSIVKRLERELGAALRGS